LAIGGLKESVADFYLRQHRNELDWIRSSVRALCTFNWVADRQSIDVVQRYWLKKQLSYFEKRLQGSYRWLRLTQWGAKGLFAVGLLLAGGLFFFNSSLHDYHVLQKCLIILMMFCPALGAALDGYAEKRGFNVDPKRYTEIVKIFRRAKQLLEEARDDLERQQRVLLELGKVALEENSEWVLLHRDRPLELPKGDDLELKLAIGFGNFASLIPETVSIAARR
jgi:DNA-directed RNA polymerase subunit K/omega